MPSLAILLVPRRVPSVCTRPGSVPDSRASFDTEAANRLAIRTKSSRASHLHQQDVHIFIILVVGPIRHLLQAFLNSSPTPTPVPAVAVSDGMAWPLIGT